MVNENSLNFISDDLKTTGVLPHYEPGTKNEIAVVFSCPGREEKKAGKPAAGQTGENLALLLKLLNERSNLEFTREAITITNAWDQVEYKSETGRSEAKVNEIVAPENLQRLVSELKDIEQLIICSGEKAYNAVEKIKKLLKNDVVIVKIRHLGFQSLNQISTDIKGNEILSVAKIKKRGDGRSEKEIGYENTLRRLKTQCAIILSALNR